MNLSFLVHALEIVFRSPTDKAAFAVLGVAGKMWTREAAYFATPEGQADEAILENALVTLGGVVTRDPKTSQVIDVSPPVYAGGHPSGTNSGRMPPGV